ncbi:MULTISPECIES: NUDIX domain-containing protein [Actinoalloteichus]|uniref:ADP-ribose pyrophosphatase n=1 Tax=Actinoalloteichus fjordicus TaxID=1612552 RepID=A0AAC9LG56_9PSEU|nr:MULTISPECIES: NUDIX domain-containing protein [Actinoalloteichus]APU16157.1 ADP-ribose pyrophosphatase [Actinoalloteichus fjordicus]APU22220.1 ADP-ribose pyrophosphatase [Actinoalloteichus sp. GBA129-24]
MTSSVVPIVRRSARAVLIDHEGQLVAIKRTKAGVAPYWTTPGGGIEPGDPSREAALERELLEELGAKAVIGQQLTLITSVAEGGQSVQYFFAATLVSLDESARTGDEHTDVSRGGYEMERIPLEQLAEYDLKPTVLRDFVLENRSAVLADLPPVV